MTHNAFHGTQGMGWKMNEKKTEAAVINEVKANDSIKSAFDEHQADVYVKTGKTGGKRFLVRVNTGVKPTLIALHL
jgi:hypothetical protein